MRQIYEMPKLEQKVRDLLAGETDINTLPKLEQGLETAARNALAKGLPIDVIHDITGLDIEIIKGLGQ